MSAWAYSRTGKQLVDWAGGVPASLPDKVHDWFQSVFDEDRFGIAIMCMAIPS